jgi:ankyrin repeat protein
MVERMLAAAGSERVNDMAQAENDFGRTFESTGLVESCKNGHVKVAELLIEAKADVNKCDQVSKHGAGEQQGSRLTVSY